MIAVRILGEIQIIVLGQVVAPWFITRSSAVEHRANPRICGVWIPYGVEDIRIDLLPFLQVASDISIFFKLGFQADVFSGDAREGRVWRGRLARSAGRNIGQSIILHILWHALFPLRLVRAGR